MADKEKNAGQEAAVKKANKAASAEEGIQKGRLAGSQEGFQQHAGRSRCCCHRFCAGRLDRFRSAEADAVPDGTF